MSASIWKRLQRGIAGWLPRKTAFGFGRSPGLKGARGVRILGAALCAQWHARSWIPEEFYILASREAVEIPVGQAAEMAPIAPEIGEFRAHYAGFFDPGFGVREAGGAGSRAVLEIRGRDVPFILRHGQAVAKLVFEPMAAEPDIVYGAQGSHYQSQGLRLSKHFNSEI